MVVILPMVSLPALADLSLPAIFSDHMVLQRHRPVCVWGLAKPGTSVTVSFADQSATGFADDDGSWSVKLDSLETNSEPQRMTVTSGGAALHFDDVLVGEVWLCSGQSNMYWPLNRSASAEAELKQADWPEIRLYQVPRVLADAEPWDVKGRWDRCSPVSASEFSAVGYFFGRDLYSRLNVPIGLIHASWGGTPIESWLPSNCLADTHVTQPIHERAEHTRRHYPRLMEQWRAQQTRRGYEAERISAQGRYVEPTLTREELSYAMPAFDDSDWKSVKLPSLWSSEGGAFDGVVWYRKRINVPSACRGKELLLSLGSIDDADTTFVNGQFVGSLKTSERLRRYLIPAALTNADELVVAVRVFDSFGNGGFWGLAYQMFLQPTDPHGGLMRLNLSGDWRMRISQRWPALSSADAPPCGPQHYAFPGMMHRSMLRPLVPFTLRGAVWYQGESNAGRAYHYDTLLRMLINQWRTLWDDPSMPFGIVQLANFHSPAEGPTDPAWAHFRDVQLRTSLEVPHTGLAVTIDIGEADDIHPRNKADVGHRLAHWALHDVYGFDVLRGGPIYRKLTLIGDRAYVHFEQVGQGLKPMNGRSLGEFLVAGDERIWHRAKARVFSHDTVEVWSDKVAQPVAVRYAWAMNPAYANLVNEHGLPASPFRTDNWPNPRENSQ